MTATCPACGCSQPHGLLCSEDTGKLETMLAAIPALVEQLEVSISKQATTGSGGKAGKGSAHTKTPINWGAVVVRDILLAELALCGDDIDAVRRHPRAAQMLSSVGHAVKNAYRAIDRMQERQYLGQCLYEEDGLTCHAEIWAKPGAHQVTCTQCGITHEVGERRAWLLLKAEDMIVTPREASQYVGEVGGIDVGHQRIRNYLDRKRIPIRPSVGNVQRFRLGDLLEILRDDTSQRESRAS